MQLLDSELNVEMLQMETSTLSQKVEGLEEECEERSHQANTWYQALQVRRKGSGGGCGEGVTRLIHGPKCCRRGGESLGTRLGSCGAGRRTPVWFLIKELQI